MRYGPACRIENWTIGGDPGGSRAVRYDESWAPGGSAAATVNGTDVPMREPSDRDLGDGAAQPCWLRPRQRSWRRPDRDLHEPTAMVTSLGSRPGRSCSAALLAAPKAADVAPSGSRPGRSCSAALLAAPKAADVAPPGGRPGRPNGGCDVIRIATWTSPQRSLVGSAQGSGRGTHPGSRPGRSCNVVTPFGGRSGRPNGCRDAARIATWTLPQRCLVGCAQGSDRDASPGLNLDDPTASRRRSDRIRTLSNSGRTARWSDCGSSPRIDSASSEDQRKVDACPRQGWYHTRGVGAGGASPNKRQGKPACLQQSGRRPN